MARLLPGVYLSIENISSLPEGTQSLPVGIVLKSNKGTIGAATLQTSIQDLLTNYTFLGTVLPTDDKSFHTAVSILSQTNELYVSRAAKNALYGGLILKKEDLIEGSIQSVTALTKTITVTGDISSLLVAGDTIRVYNVSSTIDGRYIVVSATVNSGNTNIVVSENIANDLTVSTPSVTKLYKTRQPIPFREEVIGYIIDIDQLNKKFTVVGGGTISFLDIDSVPDIDSIIDIDTLTYTGTGEDVSSYALLGDKIEVRNSTGNNSLYTVVESVYNDTNNTVEITVKESIASSVVDGVVFRNSIVEPDNYSFKQEDLAIITNKDQGDYANHLAIKLVSSTESTISEDNACQIVVYDTLTNEILETYYFSRDMAAISSDGINMYIEDTVVGSAYIKIVNNLENGYDLPCNTISNVSMSGGYNGDTLATEDLITALNIFADKIIPISILANGSIENAEYQQAMIQLAENRQDTIAFINSRLADEKATTNSQKASNIANYKKQDVASTSFYAAMYAPHVTIPDTFNSRQVVVGADAKAIPGWLKVIREQGYPYAYAGPLNGKVQGATTAWKIGDTSGEATILNDGSVNVISYDPIQGYYYCLNQNTLLMSNSILRDLGVTFNILNIKVNLYALLKQYINLPITDNLRRQIYFSIVNYMGGLNSYPQRITNFNVQDISTATDISNDTLVYVIILAPTPYAQKIKVNLRIADQVYFTINQLPNSRI
jgi:hypothetical protein